VLGYTFNMLNPLQEHHVIVQNTDRLVNSIVYTSMIQKRLHLVS